jgi:cyclopropane-fatty-acyl-phospholipid synthase
MKEKQLLYELFAQAGITINGSEPWDITVHDERFYTEILNDTELFMGESYMDKWWDCPALDQFFYRVLRADLDKKALKIPHFWRSALRQHLFDWTYPILHSQSRKKSLDVGREHYDIGNDLYECMLDKNMVYTCAYWKNAKSLDEAQEQKLHLICQKLYFKPGMTVLDIGCGWGSFAKFAAQNYGVSVVGITISKEQLRLAKERCQGLPVEIRFQDYRDLLHEKSEQYDRVVSIGMFEHVGDQHYPKYMQVVFHCLKSEGLFLLHTIGSNATDRSINKWINAYIFPHGQLPSIGQIGQAIEKRFVMEDWHNFGSYYDLTLMAWHANLNSHWDKLKDHYSDRFHRMWNYYLLSCAGSFRARKNQLWQIVLSKGGVLGGYKRIS